MALNEAGGFVLSWAKLTPENKNLVVLLCLLGLLGLILFNERKDVVDVLKGQVSSYEKKEADWLIRERRKDSTIVTLSYMMIKLADKTTKYNDSMRIEDRKRLEK